MNKFGGILMIPTVTERPISLRERQRQEREALILAEAERMLGERGYHDLVMEELAERVGIGKGTIYLHFPKKEDLVRAIIERGMERMTLQLEALASDTAQSAETRLRAIVVKLMEGKDKWVHIMSAQVRQELMESLREHTRVRELRTRLLGVVSGVIEEGKVNGEFDPSVSTPVAAIGPFSMMSFTETTRVLETFNLDRVALTEAILHLYFRGLKIRPEEKEERA
jgi:AcrR family transcriptional regulator